LRRTLSSRSISPTITCLWYITVIFPVLGTGLIITIQSWVAAYREHSLANLGVAAYNTFAQVHNTMSAIQSLGPALQSVGKMFASVASSRGSAKGKGALFGLMLAIRGRDPRPLRGHYLDGGADPPLRRHRAVARRPIWITQATRLTYQVRRLTIPAFALRDHNGGQSLNPS
jgi:hypothetical protein